MNHIPKIIIKPVMSENQRYLTCGDYVYDAEDDTLTVFISRMGDWRSELLVALHEVFESVSCIAADIECTDIDLFDMEYEKHRKDGDFSEPGDSPEAPYHKHHIAATVIERVACQQLDLDWDKHDANVNEA
jgi:hypothetical protein